jgi:hypothetical protein
MKDCALSKKKTSELEQFNRSLCVGIVRRLVNKNHCPAFHYFRTEVPQWQLNYFIFSQPTKIMSQNGYINAQSGAG